MSFRTEHTPDPVDLARVPVPRSRWLTPDRGSRRRNVLNQLVALTAVAGIAASSWGIWLETQEHRDREASRERITAACAGLVDPARVLGLNGGTARARAGSDQDDSFTSASLTPDSLPGQCVIYRVGRPGTTYGHFALTVHTNPSDDYADIVGDDGTGPFSDQAEADAHDVTRVADESPDYPLSTSDENDGRFGSYDENSAWVKVVCKPGGTGRKDLTSVNVMTEADYDDVALQDRQTLIELAVAAAYRAADRLHCTPETPEQSTFPRLYIPDARLVKAASADGTCGWYADFLGRETPGRLPDRALPAPTATQGHREACLLAASRAEVERVWPELPEGYGRIDAVLGHSPWWLQTESFFGDEAHEVVAEAFGGEQTPLRPGTAGAVSLADTWWATSTCDGEPAVHTLNLNYSYTEVIKDRLRSLFKAYVDDVTARRHCTDLVFPTGSAFQGH